jgi:hypothetical protein
MRILLPAALLAALPALAAAQAPDSAAFVTRLGADTLVVERFVRGAARLDVDVLMRVPQTTRTRYSQDLAPSADLPFVDMAHWMYEAALLRFRASGRERDTIALGPADRPTRFVFAAVGPDSVTITHPLRGTMRAWVDAQGRLLGLDAGATTRALIVERRPWLELDAIEARWRAWDAAGRSVGALSGRAEAHGHIGAANITVDYGTPQKRGRAIWGVLVPYGRVWRTGANRATHFSTDRDLVLGTERAALAVPAGTYTLFSIPEVAGGVLIVNRQTDQTGTQYDPAQDLGRVPMTPRALPTVVEGFTIAVTEAGGRGELRLQWDRTEYVVPVSVRRP